MPLPFIPVAIALGAGALFGAKKGYDGYSDMSEAQDMDKVSREKQQEGEKYLESHRKSTNFTLQSLGRKKIFIYQEGAINYFVQVASKIKNMDDKELRINERDVPISEIIHNIKNVQVKLIEIAGGAVASAGAGALASLGALGGVTTFAAAGTGTAISALSGVAATNATLAWLGGGTLAAGGFGMAGGMAMLGGIAVAPIFLVGGLFMASKGKKAMEQAKENRAKVNAYIEAVNGICKNLSLIEEAADLMSGVLDKLNNLFWNYVRQLESVVIKNDDYRTYDQETKQLVRNCFLFSQHFDDLLNTSLMDSDGAFIEKSLENIKAQEKFIESMNSI